jgi:SGNH domain (fused to AT3 domains)
LAMYERTLATEMRQLEAAGVHVVLVHTIPQYPQWDPVLCGLDVYLAPASCSTSAPRVALAAEAAPDFRAEQGALAGVPAATGLDLADGLCGATMCSTKRDGIWMYRDGGHLSVPGAETLTPEFRHALAEALDTPTP